MTTVQIIVSCTNRKRLSVPEALRLRTVPSDLDVQERAQLWLENLANDTTPTVPAIDLYSGDHWSVTRGLPNVARAAGLEPQLWIASAGYGLISGTAQTHSYSSTFAVGDEDSVADASGASGQTSRRWWASLSLWPGPDPSAPRSITTLAQQNPEGRLLIIASPDYVRAMRDDLLGAAKELDSPDYLLVVSSSEGLANSDLGRHLIPSDARWQDLLGGARVSLHVRIAKYLLERTTGDDLRANIQQARLAADAANLPPLVTPTRIRTSDAELRAFIAGRLKDQPHASASGLIRVLRDSGQACERVRFTQLFREVSRVNPPQKDAPCRVTAMPRTSPKANPVADYVITLTKDWTNRAASRSVRFFLPDWDDRVDPDYNFELDLHHSGVGDWSNEVYAHQLYPSPNYDGLLVSKIVAESSERKKALINHLGVHSFLRVPPEFPILGDCGAFGYIQEVQPPFSTPEILEYYTRLGFNYGVSIDHLIVGGTESEKRFRYDLTIHNAADFLREHQALELQWTPIGAVQGWDPASYANAARQYVEMGYRYLALGGLVRTKTPQILRILEAVHAVVPTDIGLHLFGIARLDGLRQFSQLGVTSVDGTSMLRKAWLGADRNYLTPNGWYAAIRVPQAEKSFRAKQLVREGRRTLQELKKLEADCLNGLREHDRKSGNPSSALLDYLVEYDTLVAGERSHARERLRRTLDERPWNACGCAVCREWGIEVVIFRGNNRNRRRGFHNTYVFDKLLERLLRGECLSWCQPQVKAAGSMTQTPLFDQADVSVLNLGNSDEA